MSRAIRMAYSCIEARSPSISTSIDWMTWVLARPALAAVEPPLIALPLRGGLEDDGVRTVLGLGQCERADFFQARHRREVALPLFLGAQDVDRLHRQPDVHGEERGYASVDA